MSAISMKIFKKLCKSIGKDSLSFEKVSADIRTKNYLISRLNVLEDNLRKLCDHYDDMNSEDNEDISRESEELYDEVMETYFMYKTVLLNELDTLEGLHENSRVARNHESNSSNVAKTSHSHDIRLPSITPPIFSGDYNNWRPFHDLFVSMIHDNSSLSKIEKLTYLKSCLKGDAASLLDYLEVNNDNYDQAWSILTTRYDHKRILVSTQLKTFFDQSTIHSETADSIKGLLDKSTEVLHSLKSLGVPIEHWDTILIFVLLQKLPVSTQQMWEEKLGMSKDLPKFKEFSIFLETRFRSLEVVCQQKVNSRTSFQKDQNKVKKVMHVNSTRKEILNCSVCHKGQHSLRSCYAFLKLDVNARVTMVKRLGVCENCLAYNHKSHQCPSQNRCYHCKQKHHSLLHYSNNQNTTSYNQQRPNRVQQTSTSSASTQSYPNSTHQSSTPSSFSQSYQVSTQVNPTAPPFIPSHDQASTSASARNYHISDHRNTQILLATAIVMIQSSTGEFFKFRALIDPGSEATFITEAAAQKLRLRKCRTFTEVTGLGNSKNGSCHSYVYLTIKSTYTDYVTEVKALIFKTLTGLLPSKELIPSKWSHIQGLNLADPSFYKPGHVDLLLGNDIFCDVVLPEIIRGNESVAPIAQNTHLGWIVLGRASTETVRVHLQTFDVDTQIRKFWEVEELPFKESDTTENEECEQHFQSHTRRLPGGRFEVSLPFKDNIHPALGASQQGALQRFHQLERRFANNPTLHTQYKNCMAEYLQLDQMSEVDVSRDEVLKSPFHYVVPHHAVFKESSTTTKLRVVFDAAFKTTDGTSLNEHLMVGPKTQADIMDIILKWRRYKITLTADIEKMYRQIKISQADSYYQLIFWRESKMDPIKMYRLKTVTFGTASAPYLATRTLKKLADDEKVTYPSAAQMIHEDMYVDDLVSGADTIAEAKQKLTEIVNLLSSAGFNLRKWGSNCEDVLRLVNPQDREKDFVLPFESTKCIKTLGIKWLPSIDSFSFQWVCSESSDVTKRTILSTIAKIYDPLGWISPCVISAKIFMQKLWLKGLTWDAQVPVQLQEEWLSLRSQLPSLEKISIPRWIFTEKGNKALQLHGFSDASMKAYGAAVYLRVLDSQNVIHTHLIMSKTRVAPLNTVSLPRLELCGAVMLARLLNYVVKVLQLGDIEEFAWTDSTITLCWITAPPSKWKTFISNRVAEIQRLTNVNIWKHVPTQHNPADLASRGTTPSNLLNNNLWWMGPEYLQTSWIFAIPNQPSTLQTEEEVRAVRTHTHCIAENNNELMKQIYKQSDLQKLIRIVSYCRRIALMCLKKICQKQFVSPLSPSDLQASTLICIRLVQKEMFMKEIADLTKQPSLTKHFGSLNPFIDSKGILRVGGRLQNSNLEYDQQHPIILKPDHHLSELLIRDAHEKTFHGGVQQMLAYLRMKYWIFNIKRSIKKCIHHCIICYRYKARPMEQLMGSLPAPRVRISRPFTHTGVDYAGPIEVKAWKGRGGKIFKGYFAIFVCLATKAIHLEAVSDMTTNAFLAAFRRFTARRGVCSDIYSDCGKNFVGANTELQKMLKAANIDWTEISKTTTIIGTKWNFIPPASPHFGGLWEAGVKSVKFHLKRIVNNETLTFEELSTLLTQIEACLNSRPLCPLTDNFDDFSALTPSHFLIGTSAQLVPQADQSTDNASHIDRWKRIQTKVHIFWKQWSGEYLARLQQRPKWLKIESQPKIGDLVLLKDERLPPSKWILGRITVLYPGKDNLIRVVKLRTQTGEFKRPITKICRLPSNTSTAEQSLI